MDQPQHEDLDEHGCVVWKSEDAIAMEWNARTSTVLEVKSGSI
jgi:hypothetical protein